MSSAPKDAWMPPCALDELLACKVVFVATATRAPARAADTPAARPEAPLPMTSTSKEVAVATHAECIRVLLIRDITSIYSIVVPRHER